MNPADAACLRSRDERIIGLLVRSADYLASRPAAGGGRLCLVAAPMDADLAALAQRVADARGWPFVAAMERLTMPQLARRVAEALDADRTGTVAQVVQQTHRALDTADVCRVAVLAGTSSLTTARQPLRLIASHPRCLLVLMTNDHTARRFAWRWDSSPLLPIVRATTPRELDRLGRVVLWLKRQETRRRIAALT